MDNKGKFLTALIILIGLILSCSNNQEKNYSTNKTKQQETTHKQITAKIEGKGDRVKTISLNKGIAIFTMDHSGSGHFAVKIKGSNGEYLGLLANDIGNYNGQKTYTVKENGTYILEITASGKWIIEIE